MADLEDQADRWSSHSDRWSSHSRQSSAYSELSGKSARSNDKENQHIYQNKLSSYPTMGDNSGAGGTEASDVILMRGGEELLEESRTDPLASDTHALSNGTKSNGYEAVSRGTAKAKAAKSPYTSGPLSSVPEVDITIPNDGNISGFNADQLANFLRCLKIDDRIISHVHKKNVDGKRFSKFKDSELESLGMLKNPVVLFFKEKSTVKKGKSGGQGWRL